MLDDLVQTIETLTECINRYGLELGKNEIRTRAVLIDPMLKALGWDVTDPVLVTVEYEVPPGRADYGLRRGLDNPPVVLVEAKRLNETLDSHVGQLLNYALVRGVRYGCLTDGNIWEVYDVFQQVPLEERRILRVVVSDSKPAKVALAMLGLWRLSLEDGSFEQATEPLVEIENDVDPEPPSSPLTGWTPLSQISEPTHQPAPKAVSLPDGERTLTRWKDVPAQTALWLFRKGILTRENCGVMRRGKSAVFSLDGIHPGGNSFRSRVPLEDTGIILDGHLSAAEAVSVAQKILEHFGQDSSQVYLKLS